MNISGILIHAMPQQAEDVKKRLLALPGVEVHAVTAEGRLIVTVENDDEKIVADTALNLHRCEGVISAAMIYQYGNHDDDLDEEMII